MDRELMRVAVVSLALGAAVAWYIHDLQQRPPEPAIDNTWDFEATYAPEPGPGVDIPPEFSLGFVHTRGDYACGRVAFYVRPAHPQWQAANARMPDGSEPAKGSPMRCGSCGRYLVLSEVELCPRRTP